MLLDSIARNWWVFLVRGICAVVFGILAFAMPGITLAALVIVFGIYAIVDGVACIVLGNSADELGGRWWGMILAGILGVIAGILTFAWPAITAVVLLAFIAAWAIVRGIFEIYAAVEFRSMISDEWLVILSGICSIIFGALVIAKPLAGALAVVWIIGIYAIIFGSFSMAIGFRLHSMKKVLKGRSPEH
jgi:uncharacterized membrane protein HdeD (DUF308 family)